MNFDIFLFSKHCDGVFGGSVGVYCFLSWLGHCTVKAQNRQGRRMRVILLTQLHDTPSAFSVYLTWLYNLYSTRSTTSFSLCWPWYCRKASSSSSDINKANQNTPMITQHLPNSNPNASLFPSNLPSLFHLLPSPSLSLLRLQLQIQLLKRHGQFIRFLQLLSSHSTQICF